MTSNKVCKACLQLAGLEDKKKNQAKLVLKMEEDIEVEHKED